MHHRLLAGIKMNRAARSYKYFALTAPALFVLVVSMLPAVAQAQRRTTPAPALPSPRSVFGFNPGDDRTIIDWKQITDYLARLDKASDRVQVQTIGTSTLGRTMMAAIISAPENIRSLD